MKLNKLKLKNFRNHKLYEIDLNGDSILIKGPNGSGKSNILEAIHMISTTKSLRTNYDKDLINLDSNHASIELNVSIEEDENHLELTIVKNEKFANASKKQVRINKTKKSLTNFVGTLNSVLFTPSDLDIITGSPSLRRKYIDTIFFQIDRKYKKYTTDYQKAVRQRNKILELIRDEGRGQNQLPYWNEKVIVLGSYIQEQRSNLFEYLKGEFGRVMDLLEPTNPSQYTIEYLISPINEERLNEYKYKEIASKNTLVGPHRDDFIIKLNGVDTAIYASRGQQRACILALKICEKDYIESHTNNPPILLLDDIYSELDENHQEAVKNIIPNQQTIITSALESEGGIIVEKLSF